MLFQFKIPISKITSVRTGQEILVDRKIYFNAVAIRCAIYITCDARNNCKLSSYVLPFLDKADINAHLKCIFGIVNANGNLCRKSNFNHTFTLADTDPIGNMFYEYNTMTQILTYEINGEICFGIDIISFDRSCNNDILLRDIYAASKADTVRLLREQLSTVMTQNSEQEILINDLIKKTEELKIVKQITSEPPPEPKTEQHCSTASNVNVDLLSKDELYILQEKITQALKIIDTCKICLETKVNATLVPCGHACCYDCATKLQTCHLCRAPITLKVKTY